MGGLPKRQTLLTEHNLDTSKSLLVDAGSLLFKKPSYPAGRDIEQVKITASALVDAYNIMGYDAVGVSANDLAAGVDFLLSMDNKSDFIWLSANLVHQKTKKPLLHPYIIKDKAGLRIAIIGLTGNDGNTNLQENSGATILSWEEVLPELLDTLQPQSDIIILLSSESKKDNELISQKFSQINILLETGKRPHNSSGKIINNTLFSQTDKQGKYLGKLQITWHADRTWKEPKKPSHIQERQELDRINWQLKRLIAKGDPEKRYQDKPANLRAYHKLIDSQKSLEEKISLLSEKEDDKVIGQSTFKNDFLELEPTVADDPTIAELVMKTKRSVNALGKKKTTKTSLPGYVGSKSCLQCHDDIGAAWQQSNHAHAYQTLVKKEQQYNTNCLPCHVTGVSMQEKNKSLSIPRELVNVGCESCHGAGKKHAKNPQQWHLSPAPAASLCLQCHSADHDDDFDYERDIKLVH